MPDDTLLESMDTMVLSAEDKGLAKKLYQKITGHLKQISSDIIDISVAFYFAALDSDTPLWAKAVMVSALAYFISPLDAVPDFLPSGYGDDITVLLSAFSSVNRHIKDTHKQRAISFRIKLFKSKSSSENV
ncbi:MAG: DUF1232 domain-containing protein [Sinobacterium sp.]|nr:DUF1232 domain-containing protein [Sinobacterium sp.]